MKLQENYKLDNPFRGSRILTSNDVYEIISESSEQILELLETRKIEILDACVSGNICFCLKTSNSYTCQIYWNIDLDFNDMIDFMREIEPGYTSDMLMQLFKENIWGWTEDYLNNCDFDKLNYL